MRKIEDFINRNEWTFTKTMPKIPHYYVVRDDLTTEDKKTFDYFQEIKLKRGYTAKFYSKEYTYINIGNYKYWIIENISNREKIKERTDLDKKAEKGVSKQ